MKNLFSQAELEQIKECIKQAELNTSGEIRVHIEESCKIDALKRASEVFVALNINQTKLKNGVLFYLAVRDKKFAIFGDSGINQKVPENFWENIKNHMQEYFKNNNFTGGLIDGIKMSGEALKEYFPYDKNTDINELSDEISTSN